jgi:hypothetical protein
VSVVEVRSRRLRREADFGGMLWFRVYDGGYLGFCLP